MICSNLPDLFFIVTQHFDLPGPWIYPKEIPGEVQISPGVST
jgi:hypothetical protein